MAPSEQRHGKFRFDIPDNSITPEMRGYYAPPGAREVKYERLPLYDFRTSPDIVKGANGLDVQGFTYITHRSALQNSDQTMAQGLTRNQWFDAAKVEQTYIAEVEELVKQVTGAKRAVANNTCFRRKLADQQEDPKWYLKRGEPLDKIMATLPTDRNFVMGQASEDESLFPARMAHIDYSLTGLKDSVRYCRKDIKAAGQEALDAEDAKAAEVPRYAAYSVWRPLKVVKRDPLAVCDWRTLDATKDLTRINYRVLSGINGNGEYMMDGWLVAPPEHPVQHKWYWMPDQTPEDVLILKFADTAAEKDASIAGGCGHVSPIVEGMEDGDPRNSIEVRVFAFW